MYNDTETSETTEMAETHGREMARQVAVNDLCMGRIRELDWDSVILEALDIPYWVPIEDRWTYKFVFFENFKEEYARVIQVHRCHTRLMYQLEQRQVLAYCAVRLSKQHPEIFEPQVIHLIAAYVG